MQFFDTHCHINSPRFDHDRDEVVARAAEHNTRMVTIGTDAATSKHCVELANKYENVYAAIGIHPNDAHLATEDCWQTLRKLADDSKVLAIGETGKDFYHQDAPREAQRIQYEKHMELALEKNLPLILHARQSGPECLERLEDFIKAGGKAVWHCFSESKKKLPQVLEKSLELGLYFGISAMITFDEQKYLREAVKQIPDRYLLLDTDSPYLLPRPKTVERNEPYLCIRIAEALSELRGVTLEDIARITTRNACGFFNLPLPEEEDVSKIAYPIRDSLYLNLTTDCTNDCIFCARNQGYVVKGHDISLPREPEADEVIAAMGDFSEYKEVVFCGYGEPTMRLETLLEVAKYIKSKGKKVRLNTNGQANLYYKRNIVPELSAVIDTVSISLNSADKEQYQTLCCSRFGGAGYDAMLEFARESLKAGIKTILTVVDMPEIDVEAARDLAESIGTEFRVRSFVDAG